MRRVEIMALMKVINLEPFEYKIDLLGHGGVKIIVDKLRDKELKFNLEEIMEKYNYSIIVGRLVS
ncbi:hypothetical protein L5F39_06790 [Aliarcobacter butzleri]|uniref:hypothetical protein n=1 Tax=Aliarcobacter butzleri TaxID=28197 RepID=UPI001EE00868|nr:hypothetical protein [Aliarcobacter butzleri]MCG3697313.1 hypothetical protein [Aliarcobacter butzleri]